MFSRTWSPVVMQAAPAMLLLMVSVSVMLVITLDIIFSVSHLMPSTPLHWLTSSAEKP